MTAICGSASVMIGRMRVAHRPVVPAADRQPGQRQAEDDLQHGRDHEGGHRDAEGRDADDRVVDGVVLPEGGDDAERAADDQRQRERGEAEPHRDRQAAGEELGDGEVAEVEGRPEIAPQQRREIEPVLLVERLVELVDLAQVLHHLGLERPFEIERAAGREPDQEERDRDDDEQRRDRRDQTLEDIRSHRRPFRMRRRGAASHRHCEERSDEATQEPGCRLVWVASLRSQ